MWFQRWCVWEPASKVVPKDHLLLVFITLCSFLPYWIRAGPCDQSGGDRCDLIKPGQGDLCLAVSWISCSEGSQLPCCEDTQSCGEASTARSQALQPTAGQSWVSHVTEPLWKLILQPQSSLPLTVAPFVCNCQARTAFQAAPESLTNRNCERQ